MRTRMSGGVGGRSREASPYPDPKKGVAREETIPDQQDARRRAVQGMGAKQPTTDLTGAPR